MDFSYRILDVSNLNYIQHFILYTTIVFGSTKLFSSLRSSNNRFWTHILHSYSFFVVNGFQNNMKSVWVYCIRVTCMSMTHLQTNMVFNARTILQNLSIWYVVVLYVCICTMTNFACVLYTQTWRVLMVYWENKQINRGRKNKPTHNRMKHEQLPGVLLNVRFLTVTKIHYVCKSSVSFRYKFDFPRNIVALNKLEMLLSFYHGNVSSFALSYFVSHYISAH